MHRRFVGLVVCALLLAAAGVARAIEPAELLKMNYLDNVAGPGDGGCSLLLDVKDRAGLSDATVETKGREVFISLPRAFTHPPTRSFGGLGAGCFARAVAAQVDKQTVKIVATLRDNYRGETAFHLRPDGDQLRLAAGAPPASAPAENPPPEAKIDLAALLAASPPTEAAAAPSEKPAAPPAVTPAPRAAAPLPAADFDWAAAALKMGAALAVAVGGLLLLSGLAKRFKLPARLTGGRGGAIRVVQTAMLDLKRRIAVVDVAGELIVVALSGSEITMLTKIESAEARRRLLGEPEPTEAREAAVAPRPAEAAFTLDDGPPDLPATDFGAKLRAYTRHSAKESAAAGQETLQAIADRVKGLKRL